MGEVLGQGCERPRAALLAAQAFPEIHRQAQHEAWKFLGGVAIMGEVESPLERDDANESTLLTALQMAASGDSASEVVVETNAATDVDERLFKVAHQSEVHLQVAGGRLGQQGRRMVDINRNTLEQTSLIPEMVRRSSYDMRNVFVIEHLHAAGVTRDYDVAIFSPTCTKMTAAEKKDYRLFADTESVSIQRWSAEGDDITLQTAFVAGKKTPQSERHDLQTIGKLAREWGSELPEEDAGDGSAMLQHVFLIPKHQIEGVEDIVSMYDDAAGGTFYGQALPRQNYKAYARECQQRTASFTGIVASIKQQLISEAHTFKTPLEAIMRLDALSEAACVERAVQDVTIDQAVFGAVSARHIEDARFFMEIGDADRANRSLQSAQETAESGSCPLRREQVVGGSSPEGGGSDPQEITRKVWMNCPHCKAKVLEDPCAARLFCGDCTALVVNKKVISTGNGGSRKRREERLKSAVHVMDVIMQSSVAAQPATAAQKQLALAK